MAIQSATDARTVSNATALDPMIVKSSASMDLINAKITAEAEKTGKMEPTYKAVITLNADVNGRVSPVDIIEADNNRILLTDVEMALKDEGYRVFCYPRKMYNGGLDKVNITVAWD